MGSYLADTNLLLRLADPNSEQHAVATQALARLLGQGNEVYLTPQNFIEFWAVATRPVEGNGFGWTSERTAKEVADLQERFPKLSERHESHLHSPIGRTRLLAVGLSGPPSRDRWLSGERPVPIQSIDFDKVDFVFVNFGVEGEKAGKWYESDAFVEWLSSYCMGGRIVEISREGDGEISNYSANTKK